MTDVEILNAVVTPPRVAELYHVRHDTVREACRKGWVTAVKEKGTWKILASSAEKRWGIGSDYANALKKEETTPMA